MIKALKTSLTVLSFLLVCSPVAGGESDDAETASAEMAASPSAEAVAESIHQARDGGSDFHLLAECTDDKGHRSLEAFPSGVAIWNGATQVAVTDPVRRALLDALLSRGFPTLAASYGGSDEEESAESEAMEAGATSRDNGALRVRCRVVFESGEVSKTSIQQANGEQSPKLLGLVAALLDLAEPLAAEGVGAADLDDGLAKLARGELAAETFTLRFVQLPENGSRQTGSILLVERGVLTRRPYAPGRELGDGESGELTHDRLAELVQKIQQAGVSSMPGNLWAADHEELEVRVLDHRATVLARPFSRLSPKDHGEAQKRLDALVGFLHGGLVADGGADS